MSYKTTTPITSFDIETIAIPEAEIRAQLPPFNPDTVKLGNASKPETVAKIIAEAEASYGNDIVENAALSPDFGRIVISGFLGDKLEQFSGDDEHTIVSASLETLAVELGKENIVAGYNTHQFDGWFLVQRAWRLGIKVPRSLFNSLRPRYPWPDRFVDIRTIAMAGRMDYNTGGLEGMLRSLGLPPKTGDGKDFGKLWAADRKSALEYNANDCLIEKMAAERMLG